jgi:hypothetical protein
MLPISDATGSIVTATNTQAEIDDLRIVVSFWDRDYVDERGVARRENAEVTVTAQVIPRWVWTSAGLL